MAGNRQQSRFLALLSNYDRYKELSEEAANAENASTLQFLKTLDSIEAKTQQLQTSLQALYVSSGLETFYKGILDITNSIAQSFTNMPTLFNLPIAAISKFGMTFYSLANVVTSVFAIILNKINLYKIQFAQNNKDILNNAKQNFNDEATEHQNLLKRKLEQLRAYMRERQAILNGEEYKEEDGSLNSKAQGADAKFKSVDISKLGLNAGALLFNLLGSNLKSSKNQAAQVGGGLSSLMGTALSGASLGMTAGPVGAVIGGIAGAAVGALQNWNIIFQSIETQLASAEAVAEESNNKALQEKAEAKSLQASIEKLKQLEAARYKSTEAEQAYLEASNALAEAHPELISQYASTGEAMIDLVAANGLLQTALNKSVESTKQAALDNFKVAELEHKESQEEIDYLKGQEKYGSSTGRLTEVGSAITYLLGNRETKAFYGADIGSAVKDETVLDYLMGYADSQDFTKLVEQQKITDWKALNLTELDQLIVDYINNRLREYESLPSEQVAIDTKLQGVAKAGIVSTVNSYLTAVNSVGEDPLKDVQDASSLITQMVLANHQGEIKTKEDYERVLNESTQEADSYRQKLIGWFSSIDIKKYNKIMSLQGKISDDSLVTMLKDTFKNIPKEILSAIGEQYKDTFDQNAFLAKIKTLNSDFNLNNIPSNLSSTEFRTIFDQADTITEQIEKGLITSQQGIDYFQQYAGLWQRLETDEFAEDAVLRETAESLLNNWDGTREGLQNIAQVLINNGVEEDSTVFKQIEALINLIPQNLNTLYQTVLTSLSTSVKELETAASDLTKGVSIDKALEYAQKLGLELNDFQLDYSTGLYIYNDLNTLQANYFKNVTTQLNEAKSLLEKYNNVKDNLGNLVEVENISELTYDNLQKQYGLNQQEIDSIINQYKASGSKEPFAVWFEDYYKTLDKEIEAGSISALGRAALMTGNLSDFVEQALNDFAGTVTEDQKRFIKESIIANQGINVEALKDGKIDPEIINLLLRFSGAVDTAFKDSAKSAYDKAITSLTAGTQQLEVTDTNKDAIKALTGNDYESEQKVDINISEIKGNAEKYNALINRILIDGLNEDEKAFLESLDSAMQKSDAGELVSSIISSYDSVSSATYASFVSLFGKAAVDVFTFDEITNSYIADLNKLRSLIKNNEQLTLKERNKQLAAIDKELRETSVQTTFSNLVKNANNLSEDTIRAWADSIGGSYEAYANLWRQDDGTYKIDLASLVQNKKVLEAQGNEFAIGVLDSIIDEYLNQLSSISKTQASGLTNLSDMRALANQFAEGDLGIFQWDKELRAYTLSNEGVVKQALSAAEQLAALDENSQEYQKAWQLIEADGQALADNINFLGVLQAYGTDDFNDEVQKFAQAVEQYNLYQLSIGKNIGLNAQALWKAIQNGGMDAVAAAQAIAELSGKKLTGSDVETIYRSRATQINTALSQVNLSVGSIIDDTTVKLLGIQGQVTDLGSGKYVINSAIDMVEAHKQLLREMYKDNTYTLEELNALQAKVLAGDEQADLLSSLNNLTGLTYEALGNIAKSAGYSLFNFYEVLTKAGAVENLGGGKVRITNFDFFAEITGLLDKSSEEYISVLSKYNDEIISANRTRADGVVKELKAVGEAKAGDQINIANIWGSLNEELRDTLTINLETAGAEIKNGIISLGDASIAEVLQILHSTTDSIASVTERDKAIIEDAFETLLNNITEQIKQGLQGKLSNVGKVDLKEQLANTYGIELSDSDFIKTADGWQLAADAAFEVVDAMREIDSIQGDLVLKELRQSLKDANFEVTDLYSHATSLGYKNKSGNVDLVAHAKHQISGTRMQNAGWQDFSAEDYATLYSTTFTSDEFKKDVPILLNVTPITNDGKEILSPEALNNYVKDLFEKGNTASEILELDRQGKGLLLGAEDLESFEDIPEAIKKAETEMELLHEQSDRLASRWKEISEINLMEATSKNDSLNFMSNKLPDALENPLTYAENWGKAIDILQNGSGDKKGFIDARDWYNIVNEMNHIAGMGQNIKMYGVELDGSLESASELIQKGYNALKSIDGGKMQVDLSQLGISFEQGAMDMKGSVTDGIHAMAQSQIDMLDGLIAVLETVVAMEEAFKGLDIAEDGNLDFGELFKTFYGDMNFASGVQATDSFKIAAARLTKTFEGMDDLKNPLKQIKINGQQLGQLYEDAKNGVVFSEDQAQALAAATNALYKASLSGNYDLDNIYESVKEVLQQSDVMDGSLSVDIGTSTIYLTGNVVTSIDWSAKNTKRALWNRYKGKKSADGQTPEEQAKELLHQWHNEPTKIITEGNEADLQFILETSPQIVTKYDKNGKPVSYEVAGHIFKDKNQAARALYLLEHGVEEGDIVVDAQGNSKGVIKGKEGTQIEIEYTTEGVKYTLTTDEGTFEGSSKEECLDQYIQAIEGIDEDSYNKKTTAQKETLRRQASATLQFDYTGTSFTPGKNFKPKMEHTNKFLEWFNNGDFSEQSVKDFIKNNEFDITIGSEIEGELTADQLKELASYFGVDASMEAKNLALNVTTTGLEGPLLNILTGQEATPIPVELKAKLVPSGEGEGLTAGEDGTFTLSGDVSITPTSVTLSSTEEGGIPLNQPVDTTAAALNVDASNAVSHVTGSPAEIDDKNHPIVNSTALSFIVDLTDKVNNPDWEGMGTTGSESNPIKYNQALYVATTIAGFKFNEGENSDGSPAGSKERLQAALVQVMNGLLTNGQLDFGQKVDMLIQLGKFLPVGGIKKPTKEDLQLPSGWFDSEGNLSIEMALKALYQVTFDKDPESKTFTEPTNADLGVPETITLPPTTIVVPYKYQPLPTGASFGLDSDLTNNRAWNNGALDIDSYLLQGPEQEQASKLEQYVNDVLAYKNEGGIFSEETGQNINALTGWFSRFDETNIPEHLRPIAETLNQINAVESSNIESTTAAISALGESPALTNNATADTLDKLGQEALEMCGVDAGQLERFWHILDNLPDAANAFIGGADWEKVVTVFQQLAQITGSMHGNGDNPENSNNPLTKALEAISGLAGLVNDDLITNLGTLQTAFGGFAAISADNLQACVAAMTSLYEQATNLATFNWADLKTKLKTLFTGTPTGGEGGEGGEGDNGANILNIQVQLDMDALATELLSNTVIERTVKLKVEDGNRPAPGEEGGEGGETGGSTGGDTSGGQTGGSTSDTSGASGAVQELASAMSAIPTDKGPAVSDLATSITSITDNSTPIKNEKAAIDSIKDRSARVNNLAAAINRIPDKKSINIDAIVNLSVKVDIDIPDTGDTGAKGTKPTANISASATSHLKTPQHVQIARAKGSNNIALPKGNRQTLMGELGPELYVTNGRYYVAGQNGAEFVDLPKDAIVFNHKKTKQLLGKGSIGGRGKPITNENNAISFATGNVSGPAMASAAAALAALKQLRAMWASMLNASAKDLGSQAGRGGGGGQKEDDDKYVQPTTTTADIQRWYNLIRQIDKIEKDITYQDKLQSKYESDRVANGEKIFQAQKDKLELLGQEISRQKQLVKLQKSWYDNKRAELEASSYGKIFTYDENGLQQYVGSGAPGSGLGLDILENLTRRNVNGEAIGNAATSKKQLQYLQSVGFNLNDLIYNEDGTKVVKKISSGLKLTRMPDDETSDEEIYTKLMENFWDNLDGWRDELDSLYDSYNDTLSKIEENQTKQNEIIQKWADNELDVEQKLLKAVEAREQAVIDKLNEQKNAIEKSTDKFVNGLKDQLDKEKAMQESNDEQEALTKLQRQLAILQRSGGSASQIKSLQDQIASKQQDMYYTGRQNEIDAIQDAADKQIEKLDQQINLLSETLEYQKKNGLFWNEVREMMAGPEDIATAFYNKWITSISGESVLKQEEELRDFKESFQEWIGYRQHQEDEIEDAATMEEIANYADYGQENAKYLDALTDEEAGAAIESAQSAATAARNAHLKENPEDVEGANAAAAKAYNESLKSSFLNSEATSQDRKNFSNNYGIWLANRRAMDKDDFTNSQAFSDYEGTFRQNMQEYYLQHVNDEGITDKELWEGAINYGEQAMEKARQQDLQEGESQAEFSKNAAIYRPNKKGALKKSGDILAAHNQVAFDRAELKKIGKKQYKMLHIANGGNDWVMASTVANGNDFYNKLNRANSADGQIDALSDALNIGGNGYYDPNYLEKNPIDAVGLTKKQVQAGLGANIFNDKDGNQISLSAKNNTLRVKDVTGFTYKKGKVGLKSAVIEGLQPQGGSMIGLRNEITTKNSKLLNAIKAKLKKMIKANPALVDQLQYLTAYEEGGMANFTGPAWLDGTKKKPEAVLNAQQTSFLKNDLLGNQSNSLLSIVSALQDSIGGSAVGTSSIASDDSVVFENVDVTFEAGTISSDYDMRRAGEMFKDELVKMARKAGSRSVARR